VEAAIRRRADEVGRWTPSSLPAGVSKWVPFLLERERRSATELGTVAAGRERSFFVDANGALLACGKEDEPGPLGLQRGTSQTPFTAAVPTPVPSVTGVRMRAVVCYDRCNLAVSEAGQVFAWGRPTELSLEQNIGWANWQPPVPTVMEELRKYRVRQVAVGSCHCAALTEDGALFTWETRRVTSVEANEPVPELGYGSFVHDLRAPYRVFALEGTRMSSVAVGTGFTVAVTEAGAVFSFGMNDACLGHGEGNEEQGVFLPKRIEALDGLRVASVAAGHSQALALTECGLLYSWGVVEDGDLGKAELGRGTDDNTGDEKIEYAIPQLVTAFLGKRVRAIAAGIRTSYAVTDTGELYTWGANIFSQLGHGDEGRRDRPTLVQGLGGIRVVGVSIYLRHALALAADGSVYLFGEGPGLGVIPHGNKGGRWGMSE
jgi:hypothetical protein